MKDRTATAHEGAAPRGAIAHVTPERISAEELFVEHAEFVSSFLHRLGVPDPDVDDMVQEVFMVAHRKGGFVPGAAHPRTWLGAIAVRLAASERRARARSREAPDETSVSAARSVSGSPQGAAEVAESLTRVQRALDRLDLDHRAVFVLYEIEGQACTDIAVALGLPVGTVYSRLHHARRRFQEAYADLTADPPPRGTAEVTP